MLAPEDDTRTMDALRFSLASDIVELVVLTADEMFLQTLREAVGRSRRLWHVVSPDKVGDLLLAGGVGIVVLDVHALRQASAAFVVRLKQQFPDLVIVVAGARDAETELARLISDGTVYRFIHKPMSPARARLFADAAVRRYEDRRRRPEERPAPSKPRDHAGLMIAGGCAAICAIAVGLFLLTHGDSRPASAAAPSAVDQGANAPDRPAAASLGVELARNPVNAEVGKTRAQVKSSAVSAQTKTPARTPTKAPPVVDAATPASDPAAPYAALAMQRLQDGRLLEPANDNARFFVQQAFNSNRASDAAERAGEALALALLNAAHAAIDRQDFKGAAGWLDAAEGIAAATNVENLRRRLATAEHQATAADQTAPQPADPRPAQPRAPDPQPADPQPADPQP